MFVQIIYKLLYNCIVTKPFPYCNREGLISLQCMYINLWSLHASTKMFDPGMLPPPAKWPGPEHTYRTLICGGGCYRLRHHLQWLCLCFHQGARVHSHHEVSQCCIAVPLSWEREGESCLHFVVGPVCWNQRGAGFPVCACPSCSVYRKPIVEMVNREHMWFVVGNTCGFNASDSVSENRNRKQFDQLQNVWIAFIMDCAVIAVFVMNTRLL